MVICDVMGICLLVLITAAMVIFSHIQEHSAMLTYQVCRQQEQTFGCNNSSLILITKVTNKAKEDNELFFENLKRDCMGKISCNSSRACEKVKRPPLTVHYMCVENTYIRSRSCNKQTERMTHNFGYILSEGYPGPTESGIFCNWTIDVPDNKAVVVLLDDFVIKNRQDNCETNLAITGTPCQGDSRETYHFCGKDNITRMTRCGQTRITFSTSKNIYGGRYWLSYCVLQRDQISTFSRSTRHCPISNHDENHGQENIGSKDTSGAIGQDSNTEVLVIMLSIISGITAVLLAILVVICVRCRLVQTPGAAESLYSDPSPESVQSYQRPSASPHYEYVSTSDVENARPQLTDGYCEVADALPFAHRSEAPTSPPYAEVENSVSSDEYPRASKRGQRPCDSDIIKNNEDNQSDNINASSGSSQTEPRGILGAFKDASSKKKYVNTASNTDQQTVYNCVGKDTKHQRTPVSSQTMLSIESNSDNDSSTYETIGRSPPVKIYVQSKQRKHPDSGGVPSDMSQRSVSITENCSKMLQVVVNDNTNSIAASDSRSNTRPHTSDHTYYVLERRKESAGFGGKSKPTDMRARSKSLPSSNSAACLPDSDTTKQHKRTAAKDIPPASGIVRNGIMKFEQNST